MQYVIYVLILLALIIIVRNIRVVQQSKVMIIERLGKYQATWGTGIHVKIPFFERVAKTISLKEQVADFPPQPVITKDNVTMQIDTVIYFQITDPKLYTYGIEHPMVAIENLSATTLRNIIGDLELDQCLTSRDLINGKMRTILDEATDPWGIKVNRVELKNILPPREIQSAMEKQMKAERERREAILRAEGEKRAAILEAEGEKESAILRADAKKQQQILEAEGEAEAILKVQTATAEGIRLINESMPSDAVLKIKALEAFAAAANGKATKIIIPSEIQGIAGLAEGVVQSVKDVPADKAEQEKSLIKDPTGAPPGLFEVYYDQSSTVYEKPRHGCRAHRPCRIHESLCRRNALGAWRFSEGNADASDVSVFLRQAPKGRQGRSHRRRRYEFPHGHRGL